jgi:hypothetical protein
MSFRPAQYKLIRDPVVLAGAAVVVLAWGLLLATGWGRLDITLGDSDDALRLVRVRELLAGAPWYEMTASRIGPPPGGELHWSRLLDGAMAAMLGLFRLGMPDAAAERLFRGVWPLLWIAPAVAAALSMARSLAADRAGALLCAVILLVSQIAFAQFVPGRIDHHNVQITLALGAMAGSLMAGRRGGVIAGLCSSLGLAIGVEALPFHAAAGATIALRWATREEAGEAAAYGWSLLAGLPLLFLAQTPPGQWARPVCDALGPNLVGAAAAAAVGLLVLVRQAPSRRPGRWLALGAVGVVAAVIYIGPAPACLDGPLGQADPRLWPMWLDHVQEIQPIWRLLATRPADAAAFLAPVLVAAVLLGCAFARDAAFRRDPRWLAAAVFLLLTAAGLAAGPRMVPYALWTTIPILAALTAHAARRLRWRPVIAVVAALAASPFVSATAASGAVAALTPAPASPPRNDCTATAAYRPNPFAELGPGGVVLAEPYVGSHLVALWNARVLAAPYHRMASGILQADAILSADPEAARALAQRAGVTAVYLCMGLKRDPRAMSPGTLRAALYADRPPSWLRRAPQGSGLGDRVRLYVTDAAYGRLQTPPT